MPFLLAENDRDVYRRSQAAVAREKAIMKDVEGWEVRLDRVKDVKAPAAEHRLSTGRKERIQQSTIHSLQSVPVCLHKKSTAR